MNRFVRVTLILGLFSIPGFASIILDQGTLSEDNDVVLIPFVIGATDVVTIESYGYAGGTVPGSPPTVIAEGGFAPEVFLFDSTGTIETGSSNSGVVGSTCLTAYDSVTGNCDDPYFQDTLSAGSYTLALAVYDNSLVDSDLSDGFTQDTNPGFTCAEFSASGNFCDTTTATGTVRNGDYALTITAVGVATPEPASFILFCIGSCFFAALILVLRNLSRQQFGGSRWRRPYSVLLA